MQRRRDWVFYGRAWVAQLRRWAELARQRRQLAMLNDGALKDLGWSRADILDESERPFWDDPLRRGVTPESGVFSRHNRGGQ